MHVLKYSDSPAAVKIFLCMAEEKERREEYRKQMLCHATQEMRTIPIKLKTKFNNNPLVCGNNRYYTRFYNFFKHMTRGYTCTSFLFRN